MAVRPSYLALRGATFYVRCRLPGVLADALGRTEIRQSLYTDSVKEARWRALRVRAGLLQFERWLEVVQRELKEEHVKELAGRWFWELMDGFKHLMLKDGPALAGSDAVAFAELAEVAKRNRIRGSLGQLVEADTAQAESFATEQGFAVDHSSYAFRSLRVALMDAHADWHDIVSAQFAGDGDKAERFLSKWRPFEPRKRQRAITLKELIDRYLQDAPARGVVASSLVAYRGAFTFLVGYFGEGREIGSIERSDAMELRAALTKVPTHYTRRKEFEGMTLREIIERAPAAEGKGLGAKQRGNVLTNISSLFNWAVENSLLDKSPFTKITKGIDDGGPARESYTAEELARIFEPASYLAWCAKEAKQVLAYSPRRYWLPLIALYSGDRVGSVTKLRPADIEAVNGVICFRLPPHKTAAGERTVPVHDDLIALGLLDYRDAVSRWPRLLSPIDEPSDEAKKHSTEFGVYLKAIKARAVEKRADSHTFRNTMATALKLAGVDMALLKELVGHAHDDVTNTLYAMPHSVENLKVAIQKVRLGVDVRALSLDWRGIIMKA